MPLARYFSFVGGALLALLLILDAFLPRPPVVEKARVYPPVIRIYSDRKWPDRIVYDTSAPTIVPTSIAGTEAVAQPPEMIAEASSGEKQREAYAMLPSSADQIPVSSAKVPAPRPKQQTRIARKHAPVPRFAMAHHLQFGWIGRNFW